MGKWKKEQDNCVLLLKNTEWELAVKEGGTKKKSSDLLNNVLIVSGSSGLCSKFSINILGSCLSDLKVSLGNNVQGVLGVSEAALIAEISASIISAHPHNQGFFWLSKKTLRILVCIVLSVRNQSLVNNEGEKGSTEHYEIVKLRKMFFSSEHPFILSTQTILFNQEVPKDYKKLTIVRKFEKLRFIKPSVLPQNISDRLICKYVEAKFRLQQEKDKNDDL